MIRLVVFLVVVFMAGPAWASTTSSVGSPKVKAGATEIAVRTGFSMADDESSEDSRFRSRIHIDHGFNDTYSAKIVFSQDNRKGDNFEHDGIKFENRFHILKADDVGFDAGIRLNYSHKDGDKKPHAVELGFYELIPLGAFELRLNQLFSDAIGDEAEDGIEAEARFQLTYVIFNTHRFGFESFHDFGNMEESGNFDEQSHTIGPLLKGDLPFGNFKYETGYRGGLSEAAPDHSLKFFLSRSF